jgi:hypothetical protein
VKTIPLVYSNILFGHNFDQEYRDKNIPRDVYILRFVVSILMKDRDWDNRFESNL